MWGPGPEILGVDSISILQPSFFSRTGSLSTGFWGCFVEIMMPGKNGEGTPRDMNGLCCLSFSLNDPPRW